MTEAAFCWMPPDSQAVVADAPLKNTVEARAATAYSAVVDQFCVEKAPRYKPGTGGGKTWCNQFVVDVSAAMSAAIPKQLANDMHDWLLAKGPAAGWSEASAKVAAREAGGGRPAVVIWKNKDGSGHVAMVLPAKEDEVRIAQAGVRNFANGTLAAGFGSRPVRFFVHA